MPRTPYFEGAFGFSSIFTLATLTLSPHLGGDLFQSGRDAFARRAPFRPKIDDDGRIRLNDLRFEFLVGHGVSAHEPLLIRTQGALDLLKWPT